MSIYIKEIPPVGKLSMKTTERASELLITARKYAFSSGRWRLAAAFISGIIFTAAAAQTVVFFNDLTQREVIAPVPVNTPQLYEPGIFPYKTPAVYQLTELVYAFSGKAPISS